MAFDRTRAMNKLSTIHRYIAIDMSNDRYLSKIKTYSYYQGIVFWIFHEIQPSALVDTKAARSLNMLLDKITKSNAKVLDLCSKNVKKVR